MVRTVIGSLADSNLTRRYGLIVWEYAHSRHVLPGEPLPLERAA